MTYFDFRNMIYNLEGMGVFQILLPFLLVFTIIFAVLQKSKILGEKKYDVIVSIVMGFLFILPSLMGYYPAGRDPVMIINQALPQVSLLVIAVVMVMILMGVFGFEFKGDTSVPGFVAILSIIAVGTIFGYAAGWFGTGRPMLPDWLYFLQDPQFQALIVTILVFGLVIYFITKDPTQSNNEDNSLKKFLDGIAGKKE